MKKKKPKKKKAIRKVVAEKRKWGYVARFQELP